MTHRTLFQILEELMVLNLFFNSTVNEWNGLHDHRETNSIATFKKKVLSFIKDFILNKTDFIKI